MAREGGWRRDSEPYETPLRAVDGYVSAVRSGDPDALLRAVGSQGPQTDALLSGHSGHPAGISTTTLSEMPSEAWFRLTVTYTQGDQTTTDDLLVGPRPGLTPDDDVEWAVLATSP